MTQPVHDEASGYPTPTGSFGPRTIATLCGCAVTSTAYVLGSTWLESSWLGFPLGMWLIAAGVGATHLCTARSATLGDRTYTIRRRGERAWAFRESFRADNLFATVLELTGVPARSVERARQRVKDLSTTAGLQLTPRSIRVGLDLAQRDFERIAAAGAARLAPGLAVEWVRAPAGLLADAPREALAFDALVRREPETRARAADAHLVIPEHPDLPAAWSDWAAAPAPGYATTFPTRLDAANVRLEGCDYADPLHARLAADLVVVAAVLGATPARRPGGLRTVVRGRTLDSDLARSATEVAMLRLGATLDDLLAARRRGESTIPGAAPRAARVLSAWLTGWQAQPGTPPIHHERQRLAALAAAYLPDEPEAHLRLGATQIGAFEDAGAMRSFLTASRLLRERAQPCVADPLAFLQSEITLGDPGGLTLGRVAAGLCLLWSTTSGESVAYLRDDVLDDLAHCGWLAQREQDCTLLGTILDGLARADRTGDGEQLFPRAEAA